MFIDLSTRRRGMCRSLIVAVCLLQPGLVVGEQPPPATPAEMAASLRDLWGEAALAQPGGPSYAFFKDLLPPLRYANTAFRHYPIILSAPAAPVKARWISNGSGVNVRADKKPMWKEGGFPVSFHVGMPSEFEPFGADPARLTGPRYLEGYLPIVQVDYSQAGVTYHQEAFAPAGGTSSPFGAVLLRFTVTGGSGTIVARLDHEAPVNHAAGAVRDGAGAALLRHDPQWTWEGDRKQLRAGLAPGGAAVLAVLTRPLSPVTAFDTAVYADERRRCEEGWKAWLGQGAALVIPEPVVQNAWRALVVGNLLIADGDRMNYSAGNAYDHLYEAECGDAVRALMLYGFLDEARGMVKPLLDFNRQVTRFHVAGHKLQLLAHYYWVTRDAGSLRVWQPVWEPVIDFLVKSRQTGNGNGNGLLPPDRYAGDIDQNVYSLNSNANAWRGLRDMSAVLSDLGQAERSRELEREAGSFRAAILKAVAASEQHDVDPPFIPNALFGVEQAYSSLTATRLGSYYDLMAPYIIGSGVFGPGHEREGWMIEYLRNHGGVALGMIRSTPHQGEFDNEPGVNVLYGLRYMLALHRRDDVGHALVGFYGQLAQGMTRDTFIGGEGSRFFHGDRWGRSFYLPPNSASNATFLTVLRYLLVQDWDLDDDGRPETLRLLFGAPPGWLDDGAVLEVSRAPSMFGAVSFRVESRLSAGEVRLDVTSPPRRPDSFLVRPPLPAGWKAVSARVGAAALPIRPDGVIDLSARTGRVLVAVGVAKEKP
jgi:hypothetical protein